MSKRIRCTRCNKISTPEKFDLYTILHYEDTDITSVLVETNKKSNFVCPVCSEEVELDELVIINEAESKRVELETLKKVLKDVQKLDKQMLINKLDLEITNLINEIYKMEVKG